ncbi:MAG: HlyD family efflux transporter periplasmic adaptor subunit [Planctomycetes bacterium]|nr:HlyD family efflux transporter periplasmic adaptor subunit [Planctomycetota bacterium]
MTVDHSRQVGPSAVSAERPTVAEIIDRLSRFDGPPQEFLANLLAVQCQIGAAEAGAILRPGASGAPELLAAFPPVAPGATAPVWLARAAELFAETAGARATAVKALHAAEDLYGQAARRHLILVPLRGGEGVRGVEAFLVETRDAAVLAAARERLELTVSLLSLYEMRLALGRRQTDLRRLRAALETLAVINEQDKFAGMAMALANDMASRWQCDRASLGILKGRYVKLRAMSHTEKFSRKMKIVQDIEAAMEECLDQDVEITFPSSPDATFISRAAGELSRRHGPTAVLALPLRHGGRPSAVLLLERPADRPFAADEVESLRLTADLATARVVNLEEHARWFGARAASGLRKAAAAAVGPKHTWIKLAVLAIVGVAAFALFAQGEFRVEAPFVFEPIEQQVVPAPFDGYLESVLVEPPDMVEGGRTVLATLDTSMLRMQLASAKAKRFEYQKQAAAAAREEKTAEAQIALAQADSEAAQIDLLEYQVSRATIISPVGGVVVSGDLKRQIGAPVKTGDVLFEVAPLEALRAELSVRDERIADVEAGQEGELATASYPERRMRFVVERITPMSEVVQRANVFKVRVRLLSAEPWIRPGMEGLAKVDVGRRSYAWIWTRQAVNWVRMKLWI